jgi:DNA-binding FadR family transcriptional regulator
MFLGDRHLARRDFHEIAYPEHRAVRDVVAAGEAAQAAEVVERHLRGAYDRLRVARTEVSTT